MLQGNARFVSNIDTCYHASFNNRILRGRGGDSPNLPQCSLGILRVPQLPPPFEHPPPLRTLQFKRWKLKHVSAYHFGTHHAHGASYENFGCPTKTQNVLFVSEKFGKTFWKSTEIHQFEGFGGPQFG